MREAFTKLNASVKGTTKGKLDMNVAVPAALAAFGAGLLVRGRFVMPMWYDFLFWSYVTFNNFNPPPERARGGEAKER